MGFDSTITIGGILTLITITIVVIWNLIQYKQIEKQLEIQNKQLKIQNEQTKHNFFADYTKRFQEIFFNFPVNINDDDFEYSNLGKEGKENIMRYMRGYFDLCYEEYFLHNKHHIDNDVWEDWKEGMAYSFGKPAFIDAWKRITKDCLFYSDFKDFVEKELINEDKE